MSGFKEIAPKTKFLTLILGLRFFFQIPAGFSCTLLRYLKADGRTDERTQGQRHMGDY